MYKCNYVATPIVVDGNFAKAVWREAEPVEFFVPVTGGWPQSRTEAGMLWDEQYLFVGFKAYDKDIYACHTERDAATCQDDVLEVFFKTIPEEEPYYNFEINARNTVYDAYSIRRNAAGGGHRWKRWDCAGLKSAVTVQGTLNDPSDVDEFWTLEMAIPFASLDLGGRVRPEAGQQWRFHLARYDYSVYLEKGVELCSSAHLTEVDFHRYEEWEALLFVR